MIKVIVFDIDGSIMPQGGPMDPRVAQIFRFLFTLLPMGPATGKNCDYGRGLASGIGLVWNFVIGESGAQFLFTTKTESPPAFNQRTIVNAGKDLAVFADKIGLIQLQRIFCFIDKTESYRVELKEGIITMFPPGKDIETTKDWVPYFEEVVKLFRLKLKIQRHSDGAIDIVPATINKEIGIIEVCNIYNCKPENILVVVDGANDLELTYGTTVIAVGNAMPAIKKAAQNSGGFIADFPDGIGFIQGLAHFAKKRKFHNREINAKLPYQVTRLFPELEKE